MTNLLEKALLTGFGLFILVIFISLINPFIISISEFNSTIKKDVNNYNIFFNEVDTAILFVIENPDVTYLNEIEYPRNLNVTLTEDYVKYHFLIENEIQYKIYEYVKPLISRVYNNLSSLRYILNVSYYYNHIDIQFI
ncbi:MAG: hypothetical protein KGD67_01825 [Candidatus Lokiarchaeota archaeon]|nr:hypothetical protein [Candidatus Lokiarchaeota archaeon]